MEKINIKILNPKNERQILDFKSFLEQQPITDLDRIEIEREKHENGQMGLGALKNSVNAAIDYAKSLPALINSIFHYSSTFDTEIKMEIRKMQVIIENLKTEQGITLDSLALMLVDKINQQAALGGNIAIIVGNGNITLQDVNNSTVNINTNQKFN